MGEQGQGGYVADQRDGKDIGAIASLFLEVAWSLKLGLVEL